MEDGKCGEKSPRWREWESSDFCHGRAPIRTSLLQTAIINSEQNTTNNSLKAPQRDQKQVETGGESTLKKGTALGEIPAFMTEGSPGWSPGVTKIWQDTHSLAI